MCTVFAGEKFERYIKYISSLVCICLILLPLKSIDPEKEAEDFEISLPAQTETDKKDLNVLSEDLTENNAEKYICEIVFGKFGIKPQYADINIDWTEKTPEIKNISVTLQKKDNGKKDEIKKYLENILQGEVKVFEG